MCKSVQSVLMVGRDAHCMAFAERHEGRASAHLNSAHDVSSAWRLLADAPADMVILCEDVSLAEGLQFVKRAKADRPQMAVVVVSGEPSVNWAVRMVRAGAYDYIAGPFADDILQRLLSGFDRERGDGNDSHQKFFASQCPPQVPIAGQSPGLVKTLETIRLVAQSRCNPILIVGETGTGKELAARAMHVWRYGDLDRFIAVNCATLTASLLESELFGHVKGSFTGADRDKTGLFEAAEGGSLFLDEISEMPIELQAKLLRVLQEKSFRKVGGTRDIPCSVTVIASSNRDLLEDSQKGKFRKDLYYRLAIFPIRLTPLRSEQRRSDIPLLAEYFVQSSRQSTGSGPWRISKAAHDCLARYAWPGNVRELRNVIERAIILETSEEIRPSSLIFDQVETPCGIEAKKDFSLEAAEREFILRALKETGYQRTRAAMLLGITRGTLHAKLKRYEIKMPGGEAEGVLDEEIDAISDAR